MSVSDPVNNNHKDNGILMPVLPLRDVVVYPHMVIPLFVGRKNSIRALESAMAEHKEIFLVAQKDATIENPSIDDLFFTGTIATILQLLKLPDGTVKVLVEGNQRGQVIQYSKSSDELFLLAEIVDIFPTELGQRESEIMCRSLLAQFDQYVKLNKKIPQEILTSLNGLEDAERLVDSISAHISLKLADKQKLIEIVDIKERIEHLMALLESEIDLINVEKKIRRRVKTQMEKSQREYYLNEQIKAIQHELGDDETGGELKEIAEKIAKSGMPKEARQKVDNELKKLKMMPAMSAESTVSRNYIDWMLDVPWKKASKVSEDLLAAENILEHDHYGLEKVKERILEYLAVQSRVKKQKGPILCLVGPPGVGKTSLGQSIARATNREFVRISLGGVRDEAEIRGHRRTYIGSMPGKIIQKLAKVKVKNPLFLLDEIDKMAMDFRGDPAAALLEVLDPEQNDTFNDHYLEVDYNLSDVMFIATSNSMNIPPALLDRMEVIRIAGYTEDEKLHIAQKYLIKDQKEKTGLKEDELAISEDAILSIIRYYSREAGVRNLDRMISKLCRKAVKKILSDKNIQKIEVNSDNIEDYLGVKQYRYGIAEEKNSVGQVNGLAWTEVGGELLTIEAAVMSGSGKTTYTGQLGNIMKESIQAATSVIRSRSDSLKLPENFQEKIDVHIHVPEGATPKDGPSAGIGMCVALVSALTGIPVKADVAMTGEITLRGDVLPIGGLKEKLLAAKRGGIKTVIIPSENVKDLKEIPENVTSSLIIKSVHNIDEVLKVALSKKVLISASKVRTVHDILRDAKKSVKTSGNEKHFDRH
ncbi:MAG: endopeptidase La [Gammaproteobacteria bacterium]|nr:endopeptidase La [Gammaproteobacteria bacterium]